MLQPVAPAPSSCKRAPPPALQVRLLPSPTLATSRLTFNHSVLPLPLPVIATSSSREKQALVAAAGAHHSIPYVDFPAAVKQITGAALAAPRITHRSAASAHSPLPLAHQEARACMPSSTASARTRSSSRSPA